jgi:hypothetical protein
LASLTGKRWPIVGKRLHMEFPYIDAEVSYNIKWLLRYRLQGSFIDELQE